MNSIDIFIAHDGSIDLGSYNDEIIFHFQTRVCFTRFRNNAGQERLGVTVYENDEAEPYAHTHCRNIHLDDDIYKLCEYGVFLLHKDITNIVKHIKQNYRNMTVFEDEEAQTIESDLPDILRCICSYVIQNNMPAVRIGGNELYNIGVADFGDIMRAFNHYRQTDIRRVLRDKSYSACSTGRTDNTVKIGLGNETEKVISIHADMPEIVEIVKELMRENMAERVYG